MTSLLECIYRWHSISPSLNHCVFSPKLILSQHPQIFFPRNRKSSIISSYLGPWPLQTQTQETCPKFKQMTFWRHLSRSGFGLQTSCAPTKFSVSCSTNQSKNIRLIVTEEAINLSYVGTEDGNASMYVHFTVLSAHSSRLQVANGCQTSLPSNAGEHTHSL